MSLFALLFFGLACWAEGFGFNLFAPTIRKSLRPIITFNGPEILTPFSKRVSHPGHKQCCKLAMSTKVDFKTKDLFRSMGFAEEESAALLSLAQFGTASAGETILEEGKDILAPLDNSRIFLVIEGQIRVAKASKPFSSLSVGNFLGERRFIELEVMDSLGKLRSNLIEEMFAIVDTDMSGSIGPGELVAALSKAGVVIKEQDAKKIIDKVDLDKDGAVQMDELIRGASRLRSSLRQVFSRLDSDNSGSISASEVRDALRRELDVDVGLEDAGKLLTWLDRNRDGTVTLSEAYNAADRLRKSPRLRQAFRDVDADGDGRISVAEFEPLLSKIGLVLTSAQLETVIEAVDSDGDGGASLAELEAGLARLRPGALARFGADALRLYEAAAFSTQQGAQMTAVAATAVSYASWTAGELRAALAARTDSGALERKLKAQWAAQLETSAATIKARTPKNNIALGVADYGFGGMGATWEYGLGGDRGPLERAVPASAARMSAWSFRREGRALWNSAGSGEVAEWLQAVSGASAWVKAREGLQHLGGGTGEAATAFKQMDLDGSGSIGREELREALRRMGIEATEATVEGMMKAADVDRDGGVSLKEFEEMVGRLAKGDDALRIVFGRQTPGWFPGWAAAGIAAIVGLFRGNAASSPSPARAYGAAGASDSAAGVKSKLGEVEELQRKLGQLILDNDSVWRREEARRELIRTSLEAAAKETSASGTEEVRQMVEDLKIAETPWIVLGPYFFLCWLLDVLFINRPVARFWFLENVARMPYFSYLTMLTLYESLGWWRASPDIRKVHFAEEWNEVQHLKIMEALGGDRLWIDRFLARHAAIFYFVILNHLWLISPSVAYNFSELIEFHAVDTYGEFVDANEELLKTMPAPRVAVEYYNGKDLYLFDEFQTGREPKSRRPTIHTLYDVFRCIRDDELEHVKTMFHCQTSQSQLLSPNAVAAAEDEQERARLADMMVAAKRDLLV